MDKNSGEHTDKNFRILLAFLIILTMALVLAFLVMLMYTEKSKSTYTVEYVGIGNNVIIQTYANGERVRLPNVPDRTGYEFLGWTLDSDATIWISQELIINKEMKLYAQWQKKTYTINYNNETYDVDHDSLFIVEKGYVLFFDNEQKMIKIPNTEKYGYDIIGLQDKDGNVYTEDFIVKNDISLEPVYEAKDYTVSFPKSNGKYLIKYSGEYLVNNCITMSYMDSLEFDVELSSAYNNSNISVYYMDNGQKIEASKNNKTYSFDSIESDVSIYIDNININTYSVIVDDCHYGEYNYGSFVSITDKGIRIQDDISGSITNIPALYKDNCAGWVLSDGKILTNSSIQDLTESDQIVMYGNYILKNL